MLIMLSGVLLAQAEWRPVLPGGVCTVCIPHRLEQADEGVLVLLVGELHTQGREALSTVDVHRS